MREKKGNIFGEKEKEGLSYLTRFETSAINADMVVSVTASSLADSSTILESSPLIGVDSDFVDTKDEEFDELTTATWYNYRHKSK